jgi:glycosyltransferase involved in cell wall biosynthesis
MYKGLKISVVVPAFNEERLVAETIRSMPELVDHVFVIDDCSADGTSEAAKSVDDPRVEVIRHEVNTGVGGAIITGHRRAMEVGGDIDVVMAGDAQMDPRYLPALLDPIADEGYGFTKANRFFGFESFHGMPLHRVFGNVILSFLTKVASGYWNLFDPQNGYTAIRQDVLARLPLDKIAKRYQFENDLLVHLAILSVRAKDVPIPAKYGAEISTMRLSRVAREISTLLFRRFWQRIWWKYVLWSFSPIALLLFSGLGLMLFGLGWGIFATVSALNANSPTAGTVLLAVTPMMTGVYMLIQALILDIQATPS